MCGGVTAAIHRPEAGTALSLKGSGGGVWVHVWDLAGIWIMWVKRGEMITNLRHVYAWIQPQPLTSGKLPLYNFSFTLSHAHTYTHTHFKWKKCIQDVEKYWTFNSDSTKEQLCDSFIIFLKCSCLLPFNTHTTQPGMRKLHWKLTYGKERQRNRKLEVSFQGLWHYYLLPVKQWISGWNKSSFIAQSYKTPSGWLSMRWNRLQTLKGINMRKK